MADAPGADSRVDIVLREVAQEVRSACTKFPPFNSAHEGYAVLLEEVDELWQEVKVKQGMRLASKLRKEAIQVAAMAVRFALDLEGREQR